MAERLNVLVVVIDGARPDRLSCYGHERETTPFLARVAREGVRFTAAFANAPWTLPAHASLFTGLMTTTHGASDEAPYLAEARPSLPAILQQAGYRTAAFCANPWVSPATGFGRGFDVFETPLGDGRSMARAAFYARRATDRLLRRSDSGARRTNLAFGEWLQASDDAFFAFVHYGEARLAQPPPAPYERLYLPPVVKRGELRAVERAWRRARAAGGEHQGGDRAILEGLYDGALRYIDHRLEELAGILVERGLWDRTLVVVTADHGEDLGEHGAAARGYGLYDTLLRVPLVLRCPGLVPQGFVVDELAQQIDLLPTLVHLLALEPPAGPSQGRCLLRDGRVTAGPEFIVAERFRSPLGEASRTMPDSVRHFAEVRQRAIRTRREKFIWRSDEENELYDLVADPGERDNRFDAAPARAAALRERLFDWLSTVERGLPGEAAVAEEEARRQA